MKSNRLRLAIGLVLAVTLAWGASLDIGAAKAAATSIAKAAATAKAKTTATPAAKTTPATTAKAGAKATARPTAKATAVAAASVKAAVPAEPQGRRATGKELTRGEAYARKFQKVAPADQKAAAIRARARGLKPGVAGRNRPGAARAGTTLAAAGGLAPLGGPVALAAPLPGIEGPGGVPHYFGPYGNWAFSPLPRGGIAEVTILDRGTGYNNPIIVIDDAYGTGASFTIPATQVGGVVQDLVLGSPVGANITAPIATVVDDPALCGASLQPACGTGALADATIGGPLTGGLRKFVDSLPGLGPSGVNNLGQFIPVGVPSAWPAGCVGAACTADYYEIGLVEYTEQMHSDLPATRMRGYVQIVPAGWKGADALGNVYNAVALTTLNGLTQNVTIGGSQAYGATKPHYLGPVLVAKGRAHGVASPAGDPKPVRVKFYNLLPIGVGGDLFLPVDESVPGSAEGPIPGEKYKQNRATIHLHGNNTVWISDGNTHQWITPAGETTSYPAGASARSVPDMAGCNAGGGTGNNVLPGNSGCMTFYYTNAQSARLQFYHDHAHGITRLNVYAGEAAGYLITDAVEQDLIAGTNVSGVNPNNLRVLPGLGIPLVIQDRTWVDADTIWAQDPTWNSGTGLRNADGNITEAVTGDLWYPHVYMTVQNPWDLSGTNGVGRWHYGPWFQPPTPECVNGLPIGCIETGPVPNEYYDPINAPWEPPMRPGVPNPSIPGESFLDTQVVNGTAFPYVEVEPKAVRFRILNAGNDRFLNLSLYVAADKNSPTTPGSGAAVPCIAGVPRENCTEVAMVPVSVAPANQYADTPSGIPDPARAGPSWWQIGTEGGFMPKPVVVPPSPIGYNLDPAYFAFGIVNQHSLFLGSAERADVVVDFSAYAGKTLILYNDSPAPVPAGAAPYDFYTGNGNQMDGGGAPNSQPGYGPNSRTVMQIRVAASAATPTPDATLANLEAVFAKTDTKRGVFEVSQDPILVPQEIYNSAYNNTFPTEAEYQHLKIANTSMTFRPIDKDGVIQPAVTIPLEMKAMHDEMGGVYETMYGRMSGMLGLSLTNSPNHVLIPYPFSSPPTDVVKGSIELTPVGTLADGTQIWRIFHNGVDTHPIHTHLFTAQLINRVDQSGQVVGEPVDPIEAGWKETIRVNPLEVTFIALRPTVPTPGQIPFELPDSIRLIDPGLPEGAPLPPPAPAGWFSPDGTQLPGVTNHYVNFGWEYVWHCHILSHEEMDFMHTLVFAVPPIPVTDLSVTGNGAVVTLAWTDVSIKETQYRIERALDPNFADGLTTFTQTNTATTGPMTLTQTVQGNRAYWYRVWAIGPVVGDTVTPGFPTMSADSVSNTVMIQVGTSATPAAPIGLSATWQPGQPPRVNLAWTDMSSNETHFVVERCTGTDCVDFAALPTTVPAHVGTGVMTFTDTMVVASNVYSYRVRAVNGTGVSEFSNVVANVTDPGTPTVPVAPTGLTVAITGSVATLNWIHPAGAGLIDFTIQRASNASFTVGVSSVTAAAGATTAQDTLPAVGSYYYRIRANGSAGSSIWTNGSPFPAVVSLPSIASLTANQTSPYPASGFSPIVWTATASGGIGPLQYEFSRRLGTGTATVVQAYSASNTYTWTPTPAETGTWTIIVNVKSALPANATSQGSLTSASFVLTTYLRAMSLDNPSGTVTATTAVAGGGWAFRCGGTITLLELLVDGVAQSAVTFTTGVSRPDVAAAYQSVCPSIGTTTGFSFVWDATAIPDATHQLRIRMTDDVGGTTLSNIQAISIVRSGGQAATLLSLDLPSGPVTGTVSGMGWAFRCGGTITLLELLVDGVAQSAVSFTTGVSRPDVAAAYQSVCPSIGTTTGFSFVWDATAIPDATHQLRIRVTDDVGVTTLSNIQAISIVRSGGQAATLLSLDLPSGAVTGAVPGMGWAFRCGGTITAYDLTVDGVSQPTVAVSSGIGRPDVQSAFLSSCPTISSTTGFSFSLDTTALAPGSHTLRIFVTDDLGVVTGSNVRTITK